MAGEEIRMLELACKFPNGDKAWGCISFARADVWLERGKEREGEGELGERGQMGQVS